MYLNYLSKYLVSELLIFYNKVQMGIFRNFSFKTRFPSLPWLNVLNAGVSKQNLHFSSFPWQPEKKKHIWSFAEYSLGFGHYFCVPITKSYDNRTMWCRHFCLSVATGNTLFESEIQTKTYSSSTFIMFHILIEDLATYHNNVSTCF